MAAALLVGGFLLSTVAGTALALPTPEKGGGAGVVPWRTVRLGDAGTPGASPARPGPASARIDSVMDTLDPVNDWLYPGGQTPPVQSDPQLVVYDPGNGDLYVRGNLGATLSVVNASQDRVLTALTVGAGGSGSLPNLPTVAVDPTNGLVYETNDQLETLGVINGTTNTIAGEIGLGAGPGGIVFDPTNGNLYTSNWASDNVSVVSGETNRLVTSIPVGHEPGAILFDPNDNEVFVSNFASGNVSVIDAATEKVVASPTSGSPGSEPVALGLDTVDDLVAVVDSGTGNVTVLNGTTNAAVATVSLGSGARPSSASFDPTANVFLIANGGASAHNVTILEEPGSIPTGNIEIGNDSQGAVYDVHSGDLYVASYGSGNISVVGLPAGLLVETVTTDNGPQALAVDASNGDVFVANEGSASSDANLTLIAWPGLASSASIRLSTYPTGLTAAPNGEVYATDYGGSAALLVNESTNLVTGTAAASANPGASAFDPASNYLYLASPPSGDVTVDTASGVPVAAVPGLGVGSLGLAYDPADGDVYVSNNESGNLTLVDAATHTVRQVVRVAPGASLGTEIYDPANSTVWVADDTSHNVTVVRGNATVSSLQVGAEPSSFAYDPTNDTIFVANSGSGNLSVFNATTDRLVHTVASSGADYLAYDADANAVYVASSGSGEVYAYNASTYGPLGSPVLIAGSAGSGGIAYGATSGDVYVANAASNTISILSAVGVYPVSFVETGLPSGTPWGVSLNGTSNESSTPTVGFAEPNGTFPVAVDPVTWYTANITTSSVTVHDGPVQVEVGFTGSSYPVTFVESGLATGSRWSVTLNASTQSSTDTTVAFSEPNGAYSYSVAAVAGYTVSPPSSGTVTVAYGPQTLDVVFLPLPGTYTISFVETGLPAGTNWSVSLESSTRYSQTDTIIFTEPDGSYPFTLGAVTGYSASAAPVSPAEVSGANDEVEVTYSPVPPAPVAPSWFSAFGWAILAVVVVVLLLAAYLLLGRRGRKGNVPPDGTPPPRPAAPSPDAPTPPPPPS